MICARRVALNGAQLDQADSSIVIRGVETADGKENISAVAFGGRSGQRITGKRRDTLDVVVRFAINIKKANLAGRAAALEAVNEWAARAKDGAVLTVNYKTNRQLYVILAQAPGEGNMFQYDREFSITFRAYGVPYWQETEATATASIEAGTSGDADITVAGSADTVADVVLTNESESTVDTCAVSVDGNLMSFTGLGLAAGESLVIDHAEDGTLRIRILETDESYRSAMASRDPSSADDLFCRTGTRSAGFEAAAACSMTVECKGRYL